MDLVRRAGLGSLRDDKESENVHAGPTGPTAASVAAHQREEKTTGHDEGDWRSYLGNPGDDARAWLKDLTAQVDTNARDNKGWWGTLRDHVYAKPNGAKIRDLDPRIVEMCVKNLCQE
jgi:hypothetical protein